MTTLDDWASQGKCHNNPVYAEMLFATGKDQHKARPICRPCPVKLQCLTKAFGERLEHGMWGGWTESERRAYLLGRPETITWTVADWEESLTEYGIPKPPKKKRGKTKQ